MNAFDIVNRKDFMAKLLKSELFDTFEVKEVVLHTSFKMVLDGARNMDYYDMAEEKTALSKLLSWSEMRPHVYELMQGHRLPSYFKIILCTNLQKTEAISSEVSTFFLNITFKENKISCSTGTSYRHFTLDQSANQIWDHKIEQFLFKYNFL